MKMAVSPHVTTIFIDNYSSTFESQDKFWIGITDCLIEWDLLVATFNTLNEYTIHKSSSQLYVEASLVTLYHKCWQSGWHPFYDYRSLFQNWYAILVFPWYRTSQDLHAWFVRLFILSQLSKGQIYPLLYNYFTNTGKCPWNNPDRYE